MMLLLVASFLEAWIEISNKLDEYNTGKCRLLLGGVDWNTDNQRNACGNQVASFLEAWIEIFLLYLLYFSLKVASFLEAWIEIIIEIWYGSPQMSPPSWRRGLKSETSLQISVQLEVASFLEAWIEIKTSRIIIQVDAVASFLEAWIEIVQATKNGEVYEVASFLEAWIEILGVKRRIP